MGKFPVIHLGDLRQITGALLMYGNARPRLSRVSIDSRSCGPGDLFVALKGEKFDGHDFIPMARQRRVGGLLVSKSWFDQHGHTVRDGFSVVVPDPLRALSELATLHRSRFSIPVIAVAGSNGKTGTKDLIAHVLSASFRVLKTQGNLNNHIGVPLTLLNLTTRHTLAVIELGTNHFGEVSALCAIAEPTHGLVTSIGREHLEFFGDLKGVARAEFELYDWLSAHGGCAFAWLDDPFIQRYFAGIKHGFSPERFFGYRLIGGRGSLSRAIPKPRTPPAVRSGIVTARRVGYKPDFKSVLEIMAKKQVVLRSSLGAPGLAGELASVAATTLALFFKIPARSIKQKLSDFKPVSSKRMEIRRRHDLTIINDAYNSNPDSLEMGLVTIADYPCQGRKHLVLADMLELGESATPEHRKAGRRVRQLGFTHLWALGPFCRHLHLGAGKLTVNRHFLDKGELAFALRKNLQKGDLVYLKGSRGMALETILDSISPKN
jgi:UDP-N-acetylmuramyl pentapeptide synthase